MTTHPHDHDRTRATLADVNHRDGPYWADYQRYRHRHGVIHDPSTVPDFWLRELLRDRFREAAVVVERTALPMDLPLEHAERLAEVWKALKLLSEFIGGAHSEATDPLQVAEETLSVLLGGLDLALAREQLWSDLRTDDDATLQEFAAFDPDVQRKMIKERGCPF